MRIPSWSEWIERAAVLASVKERPDAERRNATISIVKSVLGAEKFYGRHGFLIVDPGSTTKRDVIIPDTRMARASSRSVD
jgi:hypothetical protein